MPKASPLHQDLAAQIAELIRREGLAPDAPLREESLAGRLGVSRTPVRGALKLLQRSGHVYYKENAGVFVAPGASRKAAVPAASDGAEALHRRLLADRGRGQLGDTVTEVELQERYRIAKSLLAKVLLRLTREGLIERRQGRGWQFLPALDTAEAIAESYRYRLIIECAGLLEPGFRIDPAEMAEGVDAHRKFLALKSGARTASEFFLMNLRFHEMLARFSGNRFLLQAIEQMNRLRRFQEYASFSADSRGLARSCEEHLDILEALEGGDRDWAAALMRRHLAGALERVVRAGEAAGIVFDKRSVQS